MLTYEQARCAVIEHVEKAKGPRATAALSVWDALGFVLAEEVKTDREYPPFNRSTRDGYAVRISEIAAGATLRCVAEIKAGDTVTQPLAPRTCVQIMTGAAVPPGADAVVMIEHTTRDGESVQFDRAAQSGQNIVPRGSDNSVSLAAQVRLAGGEPVLLGNAADSTDDLRDKISRGLREDALVLSGGVSMGKYDLVETVLKDLGAEFYFDAVAIRPGRPAVFGKCGNTFVFGLPGNPVSTMVTFELFVVPTIDLLSGASARDLPFVEARLGAALNEKPGLAHFLPARVEWRDTTPEVKALPWQGSGDIAALARANCFLVVAAHHGQVNVGETIPILLRKDII